MDCGGYLGMPIPTIKHNNLSGYGGSQRANRADARNQYHQLQRYIVLIHLEIHGRKGVRIREIINTGILY